MQFGVTFKSPHSDLFTLEALEVEARDFGFTLYPGWP